MNFKFWSKNNPTPTPTERTKSSSIFAMDIESLPTQFNQAYNYGAKTSEIPYNNDAFLLLYQNTPQLASIVNYILDKAADIPFKHVRYQANGKAKDLGETDFVKLLQSPNENDSETKFKQDAIANLCIFGNIPIQVSKTPGFEVPTRLYNHPANRIFAIPQYSIDLYGFPDTSKDCILNPIIKYKKQLDNGALNDIAVEDMIYIRDVNPSKTGRDYYYGMSRVYAATRSINVLGNLYDSLNAILANRGALGFIKRNARANEIDPMGYLDTVEKFESEFLRKYGVKKGQRPIAATMADLSFERMSFPISEFQPIELTAQEFDMLCNQMFGFPSPLLNSKAASTYNNVTTLERAFFTNCIMPILSTYYNGLSLGLGLTKRNEWLEPDYSHVESLQASKKDEAELIAAKTEYLLTLQQGGLISKNKVLGEIGYELNTDEQFNKIENGQQDTGTAKIG